MGLFDEVSVIGPSPFKCASGHVQGGPFQTKSTEDPAMERYYLAEGRLFLADRLCDWDDDASAPEQSVEHVPDSEQCILVVKRPLTAQAMTRQLCVYRACSRCKEVEYRSATTARFRDSLESRSPWVEYEITLIDGKLARVVPIRLETREDVIRQLKEQGLSVVEETARR